VHLLCFDNHDKDEANQTCYIPGTQGGVQ
jgi:hypothetical protein